MKKYSTFLILHQTKGFTLLDQAVVSGGNFLASLLYARILSLEYYGVFVLCWMAVLVVSGLQQAFIFSPMTTIYAYKSIEGKKDSYLNTLFYLQTVFSIGTTAFICIALCIDKLFIQTIYLKDLTLIIPAAVFAFTMHDFFRKKFILIGKAQTTFILDLLSTIIQLGLLATVSITSVKEVFEIIAVSYFTTAVLGYFLSKIELHIELVQFTISNHWSQGKWLMATSIVQLFSGNYFIIAAAAFLGTAEIGIMRIAQNIVGLLNILFIAMESYIPISASKILHTLGHTSLFNYLKSVAIKGFIITSILCICIALFSKELILLLYGPMYTQYTQIVQIYSLFYILVFISIPLRFAIKTLEQNHHILIGYIISSMFSFLSANFLITHYGIYGVLAGLIITQLLTQLWYIYSLKNYSYAHHSLSIR